MESMFDQLRSRTLNAAESVGCTSIRWQLAEKVLIIHVEGITSPSDQIALKGRFDGICGEIGLQMIDFRMEGSALAFHVSLEQEFGPALHEELVKSGWASDTQPKDRLADEELDRLDRVLLSHFTGCGIIRAVRASGLLVIQIQTGIGRDLTKDQVDEARIDIAEVVENRVQMEWRGHADRVTNLRYVVMDCPRVQDLKRQMNERCVGHNLPPLPETSKWQACQFQLHCEDEWRWGLAKLESNFGTESIAFIVDAADGIRWASVNDYRLISGPLAHIQLGYEG